ncbi:MAG: hypothetical protein ACRD18_01880 [Terriglobia bacterium]
MTKLLETAFAEAAKLSIEEQDSVAAMLLADLASERNWTKAFARSRDQLSGLADEAIAEFEQGKTKCLSDDL